MITPQQIKELIDLKPIDSSTFIVDIKVKPGNKITVLLDSGKGITIDDCVQMSRHIEGNLNREVEDFELTVMSAGLTEPFKVLKQYQKNIDKQIEVLTTEGKKLIGKLLSANEVGIVIEIKTTEKVIGKKNKQLIITPVNLMISEIKTAKLILLF